MYILKLCDDKGVTKRESFEHKTGVTIELNCIVELNISDERMNDALGISGWDDWKNYFSNRTVYDTKEYIRSLMERNFKHDIQVPYDIAHIIQDVFDICNIIANNEDVWVLQKIEDKNY